MNHPRYARALAAGLVALFAALVLGCGSSDDGQGSQPDREAAPKPLQVSISTEQFAVVRGSVADLQGTVSPGTASVEVEGLTANVQGGHWTAKVKLDSVGENEVEVVASAPGQKEARATTVLVRKRTSAEVAKAKARAQRARAQRRAEAEQARQDAAAEEAASQVAVPSLAGERLDVARLDLRDVGLRAKVVGGGTFGVIVESNWVVCETQPGPGATATEGDRVRLVVDREC